ncbi:MAG: hypothetical protein ABL901_12825 [Hyphomicrobiaceae bacterium]
MRVTIRKVVCAALIGALAGGSLTVPAVAAKITVTDSRCKQLQLDPANIVALEKQLKGSKAIGADDTIACQLPASTTASQRNFPLTTLLPAFKGLFCRKKNSDTLADCAKGADKAARSSCETTEAARFKVARKAC